MKPPKAKLQNEMDERPVSDWYAPVTDIPKCAMCQDKAVVRVSWPTSQGPQVNDLCNSCATSVYNALSARFSGTEAYMSFQCARLNQNPNPTKESQA